MTRTVRRLTRAAAVAALALSPAALRADTVWTRSGTNTPVPIEGTVTQIAEGKLQMQGKTGNAVTRPLDQVWRIKADTEPALSEAEEAFEQNKFDVAAAAYDKALQSTKKDWVKDRAADRLVVAAEKAGQFPLQAAAFAQVALRDPLGAADKKPLVPADKAQVLKAIPSVERAFAAKPTDLLRGFLGELYVAAERFDDLAKLTPAGGAKDPGLIVLQASVAAKKGNPALAVQTIEQYKALIAQPDQQLEALYTLATAKEALAGTDPAKMQEAAVAYMRVVAHFGTRGDPRVAESLNKTAGLLERSGQPAEAAAVYAQVAQMAADPRSKARTGLAAEAQKNADRLKNAKPSAAK
jgi:tetratricopeptide (TPR) repeat protein